MTFLNFKKNDGSLQTAQNKVAVLLAFIYLQDVFWLVISRVIFSKSDSLYVISDFHWLPFIEFIFLAILLSFFCFFITRFAAPLPKVLVPGWMIFCFIALCIGLNISMYIMVDRNARYISGGLGGVNGMIYSLSLAISFAVMIIFIRHKQIGRPISPRLLIFFILSLALKVDGFASVLTIGVFIFLLLEYRFRNIIVLFFLASLLLIIGVASKFSEGIPEYVDAEFFVRWVVARFSIQAEQSYTFLSGNSILNSQYEYINVLMQSIKNRFDFIFLGETEFVDPKSLSAAIFYDMRGEYGSGSSPGLLLNTILHGYFLFFLPPIFFVFLYIQFFKGSTAPLGFLQMIALSFLFKGLHTNFSEYLVVISPTLLYAIFFMIGCLVTVKSKHH